MSAKLAGSSMSSAILDSIFLLGDSLTQGGWEPNAFAQKLAYVYARKLDVINRGLSGYNTTWAIPCFEQCLVPAKAQQDNPKIRLLMIWFGANDACIPPSPQHVPLHQFKANLSHIINLIKSPESKYYSPTTEILLLTPPPINTFQRAADLDSRDPPLDLDRKFEITQAYAEAVKSVALDNSVHLVDIFGAIWDKVEHEEKALSKYLNDGLHFTTQGYQVVYEEIIKVINKELPHLHYDRLEMVFPHWSEINWNDPSESLKARLA